MINDKLNQILAIKEDIKSSLIKAGVENVTDNFAEYPELIRSLKSDGGFDIYATYFEPVPDEYVFGNEYEDGVLWKIRYKKYRYIYADDIFVAGEEIDREISDEIPILVYESKTPDCISFEFKDVNGNYITVNSENNIICYDERMAGMTITNAKCPVEEITKVKLYDYDILTGNVLLNKIFNNNICDIELFKAETYTSLFKIFTSQKIKSLHVKISDVCTSLEAFVYGYNSAVGNYIEKFSIEGDTNVEDAGNMLNNCRRLTGDLELHSTKLTNLFVPFANNKWQNIIFAGSTKNVTNFSNCFENNYELVGVYNLDFYSAVNLGSCFRDDNKEYSLRYCKIDNLGAKMSTIRQTSQHLPESTNWEEEDILYTFRNCAERTGTMSLNSYTYDILETNGLIPELNEKGWTISK